MTVKQLLERFNIYKKQPDTHRNIYNVYDKPSYRKVIAYKGCEEYASDLGGFGYKIVTHNTFMFTFGFMTSVTDKNGFPIMTFNYITPMNHYRIDVTDIYFKN